MKAVTFWIEVSADIALKRNPNFSQLLFAAVEHAKADTRCRSYAVISLRSFFNDNDSTLRCYNFTSHCYFVTQHDHVSFLSLLVISWKSAENGWKVKWMLRSARRKMHDEKCLLWIFAGPFQVLSHVFFLFYKLLFAILLSKWHPQPCESWPCITLCTGFSENSDTECRNLTSSSSTLRSFKVLQQQIFHNLRSCVGLSAPCHLPDCVRRSQKSLLNIV